MSKIQSLKMKPLGNLQMYYGGFFVFIFWKVLTEHILFSFLTFISIYFMVNLLSGHKFLFLQLFLGHLFLLCSLLFWFRNNLLFFGWILSM